MISEIEMQSKIEKMNAMKMKDRNSISSFNEIS